ncbi:MAG: hypothetical protein ACRC20_06710 [Segniliparus sp.]|uniref:hypothetical protein n=1 Tax=Segniliparus sp. TaxID=2804064 RepID=UPI003F373896
MTGRFSVGGALALLAAGFLTTGCDRGLIEAPHVTIVSSVPPGADPAVVAQKAACAAFRDGVASSNTANQTFLHAVDDPKRGSVSYDKPMADAANAAAVILPYVADQIDAAITTQAPKDLAGKLGDFVQILRERANLYAQHAGEDEMNANGNKYTPTAGDLLKECPAGSSDTTPPRLPVAPASSVDQAKQAFCGVYTKQVQNAEDATDRFLAAASGDDRHPKPQWGDPDQWVAGAAANAAIIFKYAASTLEAQTPPPGSIEKVKALVTAMRKLEELYSAQKATQLQSATEDELEPAAAAVGSACETS